MSGTSRERTTRSRPTLTIGARPVTLAELRRIYRNDVDVVLDETSLAAVDASRAIVARIADGDDAVYGINTGFGRLAQTRIPHDRLAELQRNLVLSHSAGVGAPLPPGVVRLALVTKALGLARGFSGVRIDIVRALIALAHSDVLPRIPCKGSVGASGDLAPLAHLSRTLIGEGEVTVGDEVLPASEGLRRAGVAPLVLGPKEGLALLNGTQVSTSLALAALFDAENVFAAALVASALSLEAIKGSVRPLDPRIHDARGQPGQIAVAAALRALLDGSAIVLSHAHCGRVQDPYSIRCVPQVMGACLDNLQHAARVLAIEANGASDNPLVFADTGEVVSGGNFHAEPVAFAADILALAIAEIGAISERRIALLIDATLSGLPPFLVREGGINSGFMMPQVTAAALASENKTLAHPASVDSLPTSANQEDHVSMATFAARRLFDMLDNTAVIVGIEAMSAAQGIDFLRPLRSSELLEHEFEGIRAHVAFLAHDREFAPDIDTMRRWALHDEWPAPISAMVPSRT
ncbi:MAG TPA: histidine ammonia-lyase [Casimicrobiaceae bacterium]|nr:histidine ammonia-lyase [Casimicrobiaceae bacterium]